MMTKRSSLYAFLVQLVAVALLLGGSVHAQSKKSRPLFEEDLKKYKRQTEDRRKALLQSDQPSSTDLQIKAPNVEYSKEGGEVKVDGGVLLSREGLQLEADTAKIFTKTKEAELIGKVRISQSQGTIEAESAYINTEDETGVFNDAAFGLDAGSYRVTAGSAIKYSESKYKLTDITLTTCDCLDGVKPWVIKSSRANITEDGYAHTFGTSLSFYGIPVLYSPYFAFPTKKDRTSGLLVPEFGYSNRDGVKFQQPLFVAVDDSTDVLLTPFIQTRTRVGSAVQFRKSFSLKHDLRTKFVYSDESARQGNLRGITPVNGVIPEIDDNRFGGYYEHMWRSDSESFLPTTFMADIHYVSDDSFLREIPDDDIGLRTANFTTSTVLTRVGLGKYATAELSAEYNQSIDADIERNDERMLQRLPEFNVTGMRSFRPFGVNPYGLKLVTKGTASVTEFSRDYGVEGTRTNVNPIVSLPFHYKNYFQGELQLSGYDTRYNLSGVVPEDLQGGATSIDTSASRQTGIAQYTMSTSLERVFDVNEGGALSTVTSLGVNNQRDKLVRVKHTIEPVFRYTYIPNVEQDDLPLFDSLDRIRERQLFTYGISSTLYGRFIPRKNRGTTIPELAPEAEDLPELDFTDTLSPFSMGGDITSLRRSPRVGSIRELISFNIRQSYDYLEDKEDNDPLRQPFSDIATSLNFDPNSSFSFGFDSNYNPYESALSSISPKFSLRDDRGDIIRAKYNFTDPDVVNKTGLQQISNVEGAAELVMTDRLKLGYYGRYDAEASAFIEQALALRLLSACNCWHVDVGMSERTNPDRQQVNFRFTFAGLGDLTQDILYRNRDIAPGQ